MDSKQQGFPLTRFITHMEWALENKSSVDELLDYEAKATTSGWDGRPGQPGRLHL
ncbi:MAG: hypothetical protein WDN28_03180 [Chthoniobacter sp.]